MMRLLVVWAWLCIAASGAQADEPMIRFLLAGNVVEGRALAWQTQFAAVLSRDGRMFQLMPQEAENLRTVSHNFRPFLVTELRTRLEQEFGRDFEVAADAHYLVVYPRGERSRWAPRFEQLYRSFQHYFTARGWRPQEPQFPLVAVVFPTEAQFKAYAAREGSTITAHTLGYYSPVSNRILLFDAAKEAAADWSVNAETIIHEAAHQTAFNTGIHNRFSQPPRWLVEGLGTLFEARGVWDSSRFKARADRVNRYRFVAFQKFQSRRPTGFLAELVSSDRAFERDVDGAYAEAWALTFFLSETDPRGYLQLLQKTAAQPNFTPRREPERLADFTAVFGSNLRLLEAKFLRFMQELK
jgi:hypothetical protein